MWDEGQGKTGEGTFRFDTRSAVSRRVNWDIWSTMVAILGFVGAAEVDSCRREGGVFRGYWHVVVCEAKGRRGEVRRARAQHRVVDAKETDMVRDL